MTAEQPFIDAIAANPTDWDLRSVYADWLYEQGRTAESEQQRKMRDRPALRVHGACISGSGVEYVVWITKKFHQQESLGTVSDLLLAGF